MSRENVEVVRRGNARLNAGDLDGAFALWGEDAEYRDLQHGPDMPEVFNGREGLQQVAALWTDVYDDFGAEVYEYIDADPWVVCDTRWYGRGKGSEATAEQRLADAYQLRDGKIVRGIMSYPDVATALADLGLEAQAMPEESTTPDLAELTRRFVQAWNRGDVEAAMSLFAPDAVWEATGVGAEHLRGLTAIRGHLEDNLRPYEEYQVQLEEFLDLGKGVSFSVTLHRGRPVGGSGVVQMRIGAVVLREGGLIMRVRTSIDIDQARAAAERLAQERG